MSEQGLPAMDICSCSVHLRQYCSLAVLVSWLLLTPLILYQPSIYGRIYQPIDSLSMCHPSIHPRIYPSTYHPHIYLPDIHIHINTCTYYPPNPLPTIHICTHLSTHQFTHRCIQPALMHLPTTHTSIHLPTTYVYTHPPTHPLQVFRTGPPTLQC